MIYGTSLLKEHRSRRSKADISLLKEAVYTTLKDNHPMTVRQLFYQLVARQVIEKTENEYKNVACRLSKVLRETEVVPYGWIADNTRWMRVPDTYEDVEDALLSCARTYRRNFWMRQPAYVEIWIEKDALAGVVSAVTYPWCVPLMVVRGNSSITFLHEAAQAYKGKNKPIHIYYLGDSDPSGEMISRTVERRLRQWSGVDIHYERVAITDEQVETFHLPLRPNKKRDPNLRNFDKPGSVELDALPVNALRALVEQYITKHVDVREWSELQKIEDAEKKSLEMLSLAWCEEGK